MNGTWIYKGYECWIEQDVEDDNIKNWHMFRPVGSTERAQSMPLSPYVHEDAMRAWIDAGCPKPVPPQHSFSFWNGKLS